MTPQPIPCDSTSAFHQVDIDLAERSYGILIGPGMLYNEASYEGLPQAATALIVTNTTVGPLYAQRLQTALADQVSTGAHG